MTVRTSHRLSQTPAPGSEEAWERYRRSGRPLPQFDIDPRERLLWERQVRSAKIKQALVLCWLLASPFLVVPFVFGGEPWWVVAAVVAIFSLVGGYLLPVNIPAPRRFPTGEAYGVYDPRGPHGPRN